MNFGVFAKCLSFCYRGSALWEPDRIICLVIGGRVLEDVMCFIYVPVFAVFNG